MTGMILAAGKGLRLGDLTKSKPKALIEIDGHPLLHIVARRMWHAGFKDLIVNVHHEAQQIVEALTSDQLPPVNFTISDETSALLDTGGAIKKASALLAGKGPVMVHNSDILTNAGLQEFLNHHTSSSNDITLMVKQRPSTRYLLLGKNGELVGWENPDLRIRMLTGTASQVRSQVAFSGIYCLSESILSAFPDEDVFGLIPWILTISNKYKIGTWDQGHSFWYEVGRPDSLELARNNLTINMETEEVIHIKSKG